MVGNTLYSMWIEEGPGWKYVGVMRTQKIERKVFFVACLTTSFCVVFTYKIFIRQNMQHLQQLFFHMFHL